MSQILTFSPDLVHDLLVAAASASVAAVAALWRVQAQRQANADDKALITAFMGGNDAWEREHKARFAPPSAEHDAEVLHVEYPTGELHALHADDPQVADGLSRLADEVGLVQALSDRPAVDEDVWGDEQPGEAWFNRLARWWRENVLDRFKSAEQLDAEFRTPHDEAEQSAVEIEAWVNANPPTPRHWNDGTAIHEQVYVGRRRAADIPAQREAAE